MKRNSVLKIIGTIILASLLISSKDCWPQITPFPASTQFIPPYRTYSLQIPPEKIWVIVIQTISETQFDINVEDESRLLLVAIGKPYYVSVGLRKKQERLQVIVELQQKRPGIFDCYLKIEVQEFWPVNNKWTKRIDDVDATDPLNQIGRMLSEKLKPYYKRSD